MKLKVLDRTAATSWAPFVYRLPSPTDGSPSTSCPVIATGSVAGATDLNFSSTTELELFALDLNKPSSSIKGGGIIPLGKATSTSRYNKLAWSSFGGTEKPYGILAGGMEDGSLELWDANALLNNEGESAMTDKKQLHTGPLRALDFNPFVSNLLATGASNGEIYVWDLAKLDRPFNPGTRSQRLRDITCLSWNRQVQHILGSASNSGCCVIWDLKTRREIIQLTPPNSTQGITSIAWNPDVATQVLTASEDDDRPAIYMWDLRNARAPEKILTGHTKGVLSLSWSSKDSDLLLSCGKDNRTLIWDPQAAQVMGEFPVSRNWVFDVQWCPRNPDLLSTSCFSGKVTVYSIQAKSASEGAAITPASPTGKDDWLNQATNQPQDPPFTLLRPPKWMCRPICATFGFGNRLIVASSLKKADAGGAKKKKGVSVYRFCADNEVAKRAQRLQVAVDTDDFVSFCQNRIDSAANEQERMLWSFIQFSMDKDAREKIIRLLGFDKNQLAEKMAALKLDPHRNNATGAVPTPAFAKPVVQPTVGDAELDALLSTDNGEGQADPDSILDHFGASKSEFAVSASHAPPSSAAVEKFIMYKNGVTDDVDALITRCILVADYEGAVNICLQANRMDDALVLAISGGPDLVTTTRDAFFQKKIHGPSYLRVLATVMKDDLEGLVQSADVTNCWREVLALICTYTSSEQFAKLANALAHRLEREASVLRDPKSLGSLRFAIVMSYLAAGNMEKLVAIWNDEQNQQLQMFAQKWDRQHVNLDATREYGVTLQSFIEKVTAVRKATGQLQKLAEVEGDEQAKMSAVMERKLLLQKYAAYADLVLKQGDFATALKYLNAAEGYEIPIAVPAAGQGEEKVDLVQLFKHRIHKCLDAQQAAKFGAVVELPYKKIDVKSQMVTDPFRVAQSPQKKSKNPRQPSPQVPPATLAPQYPGGGYAGAQQASQPYPGYSQQPVGPTQSYPGYPQMQQQPSQQFQQPPPPVYGYPQQQQQPATPQYGNQYYPPAAQGQPAYPQSSFVPQPPSMPQMQSYPSGGPSPPGASSAMLGNSDKKWNEPPQDMLTGPPKPRPAPTPVPIPAPYPQTQGPPPAQMQMQGYPSYPGAPMQQQPPPMDPSQQQQQQWQGQPQLGMPGPYGQPGMPQGYPAQMQPSTVTPQAPPEPQRHPMGDRTHILPEQKPIFESLSRCLNACKPNANPAQKKMLDDAERRMNILFEKLNNQEVGDGAVAKLLDLSKAVDAKNWQVSSDLHTDLLTTYGSNEGTNWMLGIKRLLDTAKMLP